MVGNINPNPSARDNHFGAFRMIFASLVVLSHAPEFVDGNRHREIFTSLFGTISFGDLAVDGFFLISGYLITQSWHHQPQFFIFLFKRALRIVPAYLIAFLVSIIICGLCAAPNRKLYFYYLLIPIDIEINLHQIAEIEVPRTPFVFAGRHFLGVNSPMWTLHYEVICYFLTAIIGMSGTKNRKILYVALCGICGLYVLTKQWGHDVAWIRMDMFFAAGVTVYVHRAWLQWAFASAACQTACFIICLIMLRSKVLAEPTLASFGAILLFGSIFRPSRYLSRLDRMPDCSYGTYLYGAPTLEILIWYSPHASPWIIFAAALPIAWTLGTISWYVIERPALTLANTLAAAGRPGRRQFPQS